MYALCVCMCAGMHVCMHVSRCMHTHFYIRNWSSLNLWLSYTTCPVSDFSSTQEYILICVAVVQPEAKIPDRGRALGLTVKQSITILPLAWGKGFSSFDAPGRAKVRFCSRVELKTTTSFAARLGHSLGLYRQPKRPST